METGEGDDFTGRRFMLQRQILSYLMEDPDAKAAISASRTSDVSKALESLAITSWLTPAGTKSSSG